MSCHVPNKEKKIPVSEPLAEQLLWINESNCLIQ